MLKKILATVIALTVCNQVQTPDMTGIGLMVEEFKKDTGCQSVSVVIYDHGELSFYGDKDGLYQIGSMTKSLTGLAVQKLIWNGVISEQDKVSDLIDGFKAYYDSAEVDITVEDLLAQKSGYTNSETDYSSATEDMTLEQWAESISGKELKSLPGTEYAYSNVNYNLLGLIIEKKTGRTYRDYMEDEVLWPMNMTSTSVGVPQNGNIIEGTRLGFRNTFEYSVPVREASIPAGYFYSNTEDIGRWMCAWIENAVPEMDAVLGHLNNEGDYYAGWERFADDIIGHSGGTPNYSSRIVFSREEQIGVCVLTNLNVASTTDSLCNGIFDELTGRQRGNLQCDVWTVFDIIFTSVTAVGIVLLALVFFIKKKGILIGMGVTEIVLLVLILILFPIIFGAGIGEIAFKWAPWSFLIGLIALAADIVCIVMKYILVKVNEGRAKTG